VSPDIYNSRVILVVYGFKIHTTKMRFQALSRLAKRIIFGHPHETHWVSNGRVHFREGGFVTSASNRAEFSATNFYEVSAIQDLLSGDDFQHSLEIGAGYGRLSPWISRYSTNHVAIDINREAIHEASELYPTINFLNSDATKLPFLSSKFQLVFTWTVLQHIPDQYINQVIREIERVVTGDGQVIICEDTQGPGNEKTWVRTSESYSNLFENLSLHDRIPRKVHPRHQSEFRGEIMVYK